MISSKNKHKFKYIIELCLILFIVFLYNCSGIINNEDIENKSNVHIIQISFRLLIMEQE